jgi:hypothetical protein
MSIMNVLFVTFTVKKGHYLHNSFILIVSHDWQIIYKLSPEAEAMNVQFRLGFWA